MKKIIAILLCLALLPLNFALMASAAESETAQLIRIVNDTFTGTAGSNAAGWNYAQTSGNATHTYAADPTDSSNSALKMQRTASSGRTKMRRDLGTIGNGKYFDRDMVVTFRAYDVDGTSELQLCFRQYYLESATDKEGHSLFTAALHSSTTKHEKAKWLDVRIEVNKSGSYTMTVKDGDKTVSTKTADFTYHTAAEGHTAYKGIWQLDFETHSGLVGSWYIDDFAIWAYEGTTLPDITGMEEILSDTFTGEAGSAPAEWTVNNVTGAQYLYAADPKNEEESVVKLERSVTGSSNRVKMYRLLTESKEDYVDGDIMITFRAYDEDGTGRLNLYPRAETTGTEGPTIFTVELEKKITPDIATGVWYDCFVEVKNNGVDTPTYSVWMIGNDSKISVVKNQTIANEFNGISRLDFEANYTRTGDWYIDDLHIYRDFRDELRTASEELNFDDIANGNQQTEVLENLTLVDSVECDGISYPVVWESSDENFILPDGTVTRRSFSQNVTLTAKVCKNDNKDVYVEKTFDVTVYKKDGADDSDIIADYIEFYLQEELFTDEDITKITKNLKTLPTEGPEGMKIEWESDCPAIAIDGTVTRPDFGDDNANVVLTALLTLPGASDTATLHYTVLEKPDPYIDIDATLAMLTESYLTDEDSGSITKDLNLPEKGVGNTTISWSSKPSGIISEKGVVTRGDSEVVVTLTALVTDGEASDSEQFTFTVLPTVEKILEIDMGDLTLSGEPSFTENFELPLVGKTYGTVFEWESDSEYLVINGDMVTVYRPPFDKGDQTVNISLKATFGGEEYSYNYPVIVPREGTDEQIVDAVMASLDFAQISDESKDNVTQNLALVTEIDGVQIVWSTEDDDYIDVLSGEVFRPVPGEDAQPVSLVATFIRGYIEKDSDYSFTLLPFENDSEVLEKAKEALLPSVLSAEKLNMITENLTLPTEWKYGTAVSWSCTPDNNKYADCLETSGEEGIVTRPEWGCTSAKMTLTATISYKDVAPVTRTYRLEILEKNYMEEYAELWREDFEAWDDAYGDEPDGGDSWSIDGGVETDQIKATIENAAYEYGDVVKTAEENKVFKADRSVVNNGVGYVYASADKAYGGIVYIGLDFKIPTGGEFKLNGRNGGQDQAPVSIVIVDEETTNIYAGKYSIDVPDGLVKPDAWNRIKLEINVAKEAYHIYVNEECITDNLDIVGADDVGIDTTYGVPYNYYGQGYETAIKNFRMVFQKGFEEGYYIDNAYMANTIMYTEAQLSLADAWEKEFLAKNDISRITDTLVFPAVEAQGVRIFFYSDNSKIIDEAGMIQLASGEGDVSFRVGFNDGFTEYTKAYKLHVVKDAKAELTDEEAVKADFDAAINTIKSSGMLSSLTSNLAIPTTGENGSIITAVSSDTSVLSNSGTITRGSSDKSVTLTVTVEKNGITKQEVLDITVAKKTVQSSTTSSSGGSSGGGVKVTYGEQSKGDTGIDITQPDNENKDKAKFNDLTDEHWAYSELMYMAENGIMNGTGDGNIQPERTILREEFIKMLVLSLGLDLTEEEAQFTDVSPNAWYTPYIQTAKKAGLVNGYEDGRVGIGEEISRQDMAVMIFRAAEIAESGADNLFGDDDVIADYAKSAVYTLKDIGVVNGKDNGNFAPGATATRAETACMLYRAIKKDLFK